MNEQEQNKKEIDELIGNIEFPEDSRERLIVNELPKPHILISLEFCPSCGGGRLSILETIEKSFLFCPSCNNVIYEMVNEKSKGFY